MTTKKTVALAIGFVLTATVSFANADTNSMGNMPMSNAPVTHTSHNNYPPEIVSLSTGQATLIRGTVTAIDANSITVSSWGNSWKINVLKNTKITPNNSIADILPGDFVGIRGSTHSLGQSIDATLIRNWTKPTDRTPAALMSSISGSSSAVTTDMRHESGSFEVPAGTPAPTIAIDSQPDMMGGWNVHISTTNFKFAPEHASADAILGEGHAHVYVDGKKVARAYGNWIYVASPGAGTHTIKVALNANDHRPYTVQGVEVAAIQTVTSAEVGTMGAMSMKTMTAVATTSSHPYYKQLEDSHKAMMAAMMSTSSSMAIDMPDNRKIIAVVLYNEFEPLDAIGPLEVLGQMYKDYKVVTVAKQKGEVASAFGTKVVADYSFDELKHPAIIVVPGGLFGTIAASKDAATLAWLREADKTSEYTTSVCTGAWILAAAGLLNGREASTHWTGADYLQDFGVKYTGKRYTIDGKYITAAGVSAGIDMGFKLVAMIEGDDAAKVAQLGLEYDPQPPFDAGSPAKADPELVRIMREQMKDHLMAAAMMK